MIAVPYLGFESNFHFFTCPILGIRDNLGAKQSDNLPDQSLLHLRYRGCSEPPYGVQAKGSKSKLFSKYCFLKLVNGSFNDNETHNSIWRLRVKIINI